MERPPLLGTNDTGAGLPRPSSTSQLRPGRRAPPDPRGRAIGPGKTAPRSLATELRALHGAAMAWCNVAGLSSLFLKRPPLFSNRNLSTQVASCSSVSDSKREPVRTLQRKWPMLPTTLSTSGFHPAWPSSRPYASAFGGVTPLPRSRLSSLTRPRRPSRHDRRRPRRNIRQHSTAQSLWVSSRLTESSPQRQGLYAVTIGAKVTGSGHRWATKADITFRNGTAGISPS